VPAPRPLRGGDLVRTAGLARDGRGVVPAGRDRTARVGDASNGQAVSPALPHDWPVEDASFSPDGRWVATASMDGTARLWDAATGRPLGPSLPHGDRVWAIAFDPQSQMLLTGAEDSKARLWRIPDPLEGSVERVILWAQVVPGMELDAGGGFHALDPQSWQQRRQQLDLRNRSQ